MLPVAKAARANLTLRLGVISAGVSLHGVASEESDAALSRLCIGVGTSKHPPSPIKRTEACPVCRNGDESTYTRGRKVGSAWAVLTPEELTELASAGTVDKDVIDLRVHPADEVPVVPTGSGYFVAPSAASAGGCAVLAEVLRQRPNLVLLAEFAVRGKPSLFQLILAGEGLLLRPIARPHQLREAPAVAGGSVNEPDLDLALRYSDALCRPFDQDEYIPRADRLVGELLDGRTPVSAVAESSISLNEALQAELRKLNPPVNRRRRGTKGSPKVA